MALPKIGLSAVLEGYAPFKKALDSVNKGMADAAKQAKATEKAASPLSQALDKAGFSFDSVKNKISQFTGINGQAIDGISQIAQAFGPMAVAAGAALVAVAALGAGFLALGNRGAALVPLGDSFDNLTASVGISSQALLIDLRKAANGTVSDFDLIRRANLALVGSTGEFGKAFGKALPAVLASARAAAKATGQDVDFLFQSLVAGIKRASPRLIDNTGIVLKLSEAEATLAEQLGKSVEQLTLEEKQIAVLNATVAAGAKLIDSLGDANETNAEKLARSSAIITNTFDSLALAVQPAFGVVLDIVNGVLENFQKLAVGLAPILGSIASILTDVFGGIFEGLMTFIQPIFDGIVSFLPYIAILFQGIANIAHGAWEFIQGILSGIVNLVQGIGQSLFGLKIDTLGKNLFEGAAAIFGSFANGIIATANTVIFPAVIAIAKFIADFLIGFSPPKKGPLSEIDKGGENIMKAWLEGIAGVSLDPVKDVAAEVSAALGDIGKLSIGKVDARLKMLDAALLPFQQRLDIVKSQFDAIAEPAKAALDAIDRQMTAAQEALMNGDVNAANTIRQLDAARAAIQGQLDAQQAVVDKQQIQLSLAQASQAQERALLNIRKAQLTITEKVAAAAKGGAAVKDPKVPKGAGGEAPVVDAAPGSGGGFVSPDVNVNDLIGGQAAVDAAAQGLNDAFMGAIDPSNLELFGENSFALQEQFDRIGSVDLGAKLGDKFKGLTDLFDPSVENSPANLVSRFFGGAEVEGSFASFVSALPDKLSTIAHDVGVRLGESLRAAFVFLTGSADEQGSLRYILATLSGDSSVDGSVANFFSLIPERAAEAASGLFTALDDAVFKPVRDFLTGEGPGTLSDIILGAIFFFEQLPSQVLFALAGFAQSIYGALVVPVITAVNGLIGLVESAIQGFIGGIADFIQGIVDGLADFAPQFLRDAAAGLRDAANSVSFGRISTEIPDFLKPPAAAAGGMFSKGLVQVGERGPELIGSASKIGVLPAQITQALQGLSSIVAQPSPMLVPGGDTYNSNSSNYTFNGVQSDNDARRRYNSLRAGMR